MFLIDLQQGRIIDDSEIKSQLANVRPYRQWIERLRLKLESLPTQKLDDTPNKTASLLNRQQAFGWTQADFKFVLQPMAANGEEATGSMGNDAPLSVLSNRSQPLPTYFRPLFPPVNNPPPDHIPQY